MNDNVNEGRSSSNEQLLKKLEEENAELRRLVGQHKEDIERIVEQRTRELLDLIETKDKFYRIIAHELRNPFNSILGFLGILLKNIRSYDLNEIEKLLTIVYRSSNVSFELLVSLSEWLNTQSKSLPFKPKNENIDQILSDAIVSAQLSAQKKRINITSHIPTDIYAYVDKNMISTVFRNLINNAIKFSNDNGKIEISAKESNHFIEVSVRDSGIGISVESLTKIFEMEGFNNTIGTAQETGTGLGLLLCKEFVEIEGGKIWVESTLGQGSEFKFTVPNPI